ncbi:hypothetical protein V8C35DRAFT_286340 [Trichoderma chlorosporum]
MGQVQYAYEDYTIGWVCALPNEQAAALFMLDERHEDLDNPPNDQNAYTLGSIGKHKVVIAGLPKGRYGNNSSATVATRMVSTFPNIRVGLMVGIGGGIPQKTRLGDVVISCPSGTEPGVVQWDMGKAEQGGQFKRTGSLAPPPTVLLTALGKFEADQIASRQKILYYLDGLRRIPSVPSSFLKSDSLRDVLFDSKYAHVEGENCNQCDENMTIKRTTREDDMVIHCGLIASGNQVVKDALLRDNLYEKFDRNVLCVEMEAAGLMNDFPCIIIRGISDYADSHKNEKWQNYAATVAAACAKAFLTVVPAGDVDKLQRVQVSITPNVFQGAKKYVAGVRGWWGEKQNNLFETELSTGEIEGTNKDEAIQHTTSLTTLSNNTAPEATSTERDSDVNSKATSPDKNAQTQASLELLLREAPALLAKMVQGPEVDAALKTLIKSLKQLQLSQEGMAAPQNTDWNSYPQTPPMSPQKNTWPDSVHNSFPQVSHEFDSISDRYVPAKPSRSPSRALSIDNVCVQDLRGPDSRNHNYNLTQHRPDLNNGIAPLSTCYSRDGFDSPAYLRSSTFPSDPCFNQYPIHTAPQHTNYRNNGYNAENKNLQTENYSKLPPRPSKLRDDVAMGGYYRDYREPEHHNRMKPSRHHFDTRANDNQYKYQHGLNETQRRIVYSELPSNNDTNPQLQSGSLDQGRVHPATNQKNSDMSPTRLSEILSEGLFSQIKKGNAAAVKRLLEKGAEIERVDKDGFTPLWRAVQSGRCDVIQVLLDQRANIEALNTRGENILAWALEHHQDEVINMLVK